MYNIKNIIVLIPQRDTLPMYTFSKILGAAVITAACFASPAHAWGWGGPYNNGWNDSRYGDGWGDGWGNFSMNMSGRGSGRGRNNYYNRYNNYYGPYGYGHPYGYGQPYGGGYPHQAYPYAAPVAPPPAPAMPDASQNR